MTTYELPPEPEVGSRVRDHHGHVWTHTNDGWSHPELTSSGLSWGAVMAYASPAELIEPDPWPTDELIVATREGKGRRLMGAYSLTSRDYADITGMRAGEVDDMVTHHREPLTNVVPVTVVPVAELEAHRASIKALGYGTQGGTRGMPGSLLDTALRLLEATDALGVDL